MCICLKHCTVLSHGPQFPKTILTVIIILIRSSSQKHLFLFHCKNTNTQKRNFFSHQQIYSPPLPESLSSAFSSVRANELPIHFSKTSPPLVQWFPSSLAYSRSLFPQLYLLSPTISSVFPLVLHHSQEKKHYVLCLKSSFPTMYLLSYHSIWCRLNCVPQKKIC